MVAQSLKGTVVVITGAASGLGRAMARGLAGAGAHVVATASHNAAALEALAAEARRLPGSGAVVPLLGDVTNEADCDKVAATAMATFGALHVLVNNAGRGMKYVSEAFMTTPTRFWETDPQTWQMIINTNVNGPFLMSRAVVPHLLAAGWGRIINISMSYETMRRRGFSPYGPSKAALESETIIWSQDLKDTPITVNALLPGAAVETGMIPESFPAEARARLLRPEIMVPPLLWLVSEQSNGFTGHRIIASEWSPDKGESSARAGWQ
jgi:NAD(P)-dependent dehydrogenase (short-subunit alcohol dehydrogenase family)